MKRRLAVAAVLGMVFAAVFAAAAWATTIVFYLAPGTVLQPGHYGRTGWTGAGWTENYMTWSDPDGGTPNMCSNYINTSYVKLKTDKCSGSHIVDDTRFESDYAAAVCLASGSNNYPVELTNNGCWASHN